MIKNFRLRTLGHARHRTAALVGCHDQRLANDLRRRLRSRHGAGSRSSPRTSAGPRRRRSRWRKQVSAYGRPARERTGSPTTSSNHPRARQPRVGCRGSGDRDGGGHGDQRQSTAIIRRAGSLPSKSPLAGRPSPAAIGMRRPVRRPDRPRMEEVVMSGYTESTHRGGHGFPQEVAGRHPCSIETDSTRSSSGSGG